MNNCRTSVVIAWVNDIEWLVAGLKGLIDGTLPPDEIIIATRREMRQQKLLLESFPQIKIIAALPNTGITKLRSLGLAAACGKIVFVTEDHCVPSKNWLEIAVRRIDEGADIVGGPVENSWTARIRDWAAFLTEYAFAVKSAVPAQNALAGNNIAYRQNLLTGLCETLDAGLWESFYLDELKNQDVKLIYDEDMMISHHRPFDFFYFVAQRFYFCRSFAEMRSQFLNRLGRAKYGAGSLLLPPFLWLRGLRILLAKRRYVALYLRCTPLIAVYLCAGACGEMFGYIFGGGNSLARIE
jgi:Glycosyl transferase family 2